MRIKNKFYEGKNRETRVGKLPIGGIPGPRILLLYYHCNVHFKYYPDCLYQRQYFVHVPNYTDNYSKIL